MNPLLSEAIGSILRWLLAGAAGWLVQHGIWTQAQSQTYIMAAALAVLSLGWSLWQKYKSRVHFLTALEVPAGTSEDAVKFRVADGRGASLTVLCLAALLGGGMLVSSCTGLRRSVDPATVRGQLAEKTNRVEHAIAPLQDLEIQAERAALVIATDASARERILKAHVIVQKDIKTLSTDVRHVAEVAVGLSSDPQPLATLIQQLTTKVQPLVDEIAMQFGASQATRTAIGAAGTVLAGAIAAIGS
jgi:hypothetical protein